LLWRAAGGVLISPNASLFRQKREVATREADELNDLHQAEIVLARANVVNCDMAATALHKAVMTEIATQWVELEAADATDRCSAAAMPATPLEAEPEEPTDSSDVESSSSEENSWELAEGGGGGGGGGAGERHIAGIDRLQRGRAGVD
jgi:hypothetical protein